LSHRPIQLKQLVFLVLVAVFLVATIVAQKPTSAAQPRPKHPIQRPGRATSAHLVGVNVPKSANCPVMLHFAGTIAVDGPTEVEYTWVSFDGGTWPHGTEKFIKAGTARVSQEWKLGAPGETVHGWLQLKVLKPNNIVSGRAPFNVRCAAPGGHPRKK
jgi:hypothetical protein